MAMARPAVHAGEEQQAEHDRAELELLADRVGGRAEDARRQQLDRQRQDAAVAQEGERHALSSATATNVSMIGSIVVGLAAGQEELLATGGQDDGDPDRERDDEDVVADRPHPRRPVAEVVASG